MAQPRGDLGPRGDGLRDAAARRDRGSPARVAEATRGLSFCATSHRRTPQDAILKPTPRSTFFFWVPLAATWLMMGFEGPFLAAVIARLADPTFNLAAYGVAYAFAILVEAPVIMLMSASTALVEDSLTYRRLRNFTHGLCAVATALLVLLLVPSVHRWITGTLIGLPDSVASITYGAFWLFLPWPAAIGYRRFWQGLLIRAGRTRLVAVGTVIRLIAMGLTALALAWALDLPGAWVGAASLSAGVLVEAVAARLMSSRTIEALRATVPIAPPETSAYGHIARFYLPLALTSLIGLTVQPMLTFFMGRAPSALESLAVFPVVHALSFLFRALGLSYQEAAIALLGKDNEYVGEMARFGLLLGLASSAGLALVVFTPLAGVWFGTLSGLTPELTAVAMAPARVLVPLPALSVLLSLQRAVLVQGRRTNPITGATIVEVVVVAGAFVLFGFGLDLIGVTAAFLAFLVGRLAGTLYLVPSCRAVLGRGPTPLRPAGTRSTLR